MKKNIFKAFMKHNKKYFKKSGQKQFFEIRKKMWDYLLNPFFANF